MRLGACFLSALLALTLLSGPSSAAAEKWRSAELWGGDVRALEVDPRDPDYLLAGTASGQIFVSVDAGESWRPAGAPAAFSGWSVQALLFDPNQTQRVWAALTRIWDETGFVAMSEDRGVTWQVRADGLPERQVYSLAAVAGSPGRLYAGTRVGVYGSRDHGRSWSHLTAGVPELLKVTSLLVDPARRATLYAGTWRRAYRSDDGGATWRRLDEGMALDSEVFSLQPVPGRPGELWASTCGWVYRGRGHGDAWTRFSQGLSERRTPSFQVLPSGRVLAGTVDGIFASDDGGASWRRVGAEGLPVHVLEHHPSRPELVFAGTEGGGVWRSTDGGGVFGPATDGLSSLRLAGLAAGGTEVVAAVRNAGPASGVYSSFDGGRSYPVGPVRLPAVLDLAAAEDRFYAATEAGLYQRYAGRWQRVEDLGQRRIDEVVAHSGWVLARSGGIVYRRVAEGFEALALPGLAPRAMTVIEGTIWLADAAGRVHRWAGGAVEAVEGPFLGQRLAAAAGELLVSGSAGVWRGGNGDGWTEVEPRPAAAVATGDGRWPLLVVTEEGAALRRPATGESLALDLWVAPDEVSGALLRDGRLLVATIGYGVLVTELPAAPAGVAASAPTGVATAR